MEPEPYGGGDVTDAYDLSTLQDPFCGIGTVGRGALGRSFCGIDLNPMRVALTRVYMRRGTPRMMM